MSFQPATASPTRESRRSPLQGRSDRTRSMRTVDVDNTLVHPPVPGDDRRRVSNATFAVRPCSRDRIAIGVRGDIDAVNGRDLARYVVHHTRASRQLVLDLRSVDFVGTQGCTAPAPTSTGRSWAAATCAGCCRSATPAENYRWRTTCARRCGDSTASPTAVPIVAGVHARKSELTATATTAPPDLTAWPDGPVPPGCADKPAGESFVTTAATRTPRARCCAPGRTTRPDPVW